MVPVKYNIRSLRARWVASLLTVLGTGLVVWASVLAFGLGAGLDHTLEVSSDPLDLIALRKGATSETSSGIEDERVRQIITLSGIATDPQGRPFASPELVIVVNTVRRNEGGRTNLILRGVTPVARQLRPGFRLVEGRDLKPGLREAITSRSVAERFENAGLGQQFKALGTTFRIVGLFEAGDSAIESEIWTDVKILGQAAKREGAVSSVQLRSASLDHMKNLQKRLADDQRFGLKAVTEAQYYADQAESGTAIKIVGQIISTFLTFGALFAVANTMFGAVAARSREIGTLRALGFGRVSIMGGFLLESLLLCLAGGALGSLATLPINGLSTGTANWVTFSELTFSFRFGPDVLAYGVVLAIFMGLLGGLLPAIRATRMKIVDALREI